MNDAEKIIKQARKEMQAMLNSVYEYNSGFILDKEQEKLLERVLFAMSVADRTYFYEGEYAYSDEALPIGKGQTISQPSTVARMLILAGLEEGDNVLEVGTGSGWNASLIALLVYPGNAVSVEIFAELKERAEKNLAGLRQHMKQKKPEIYEKLSRINFYAEDIFKKGRAWKKNYDKIIITAGIEEKQEKKIEKLAKNLLKKNGKLICPYKYGPLIAYKNEGKGKLAKNVTREEYAFVPLLE